MDVKFLNSELVRAELLTKIIYFEKLNSTTYYAKKNKTEADTLILTSNQTKGIGRFNRIWHSIPQKNLTFSLTKSLVLPIDKIHLINFYTSYILFETLKNFLSKFSNLDFSLKWPNDILLNGKKISGLLLEINNLKYDLKNFIIGIGINVNQENFSNELILKATSLKKEIGIEVNSEMLLINFVKNFYSQLSLIKKEEVLMKKWISNTNIIGKKINFKVMDDDIALSAMVTDIDFDGGLKLKLDDGGIKKFYSGEISLGYI
ncbi:MAG: biotin--[acetyl-CoA-carboxylase] ligase [bacterium]